jgi:hypothetical protein
VSAVRLRSDGVVGPTASFAGVQMARIASAIYSGINATMY